MVMKIKDVFTTKYGEWQVYYSVAGGAWTTLHGSKGYWYADPTLISYQENIYLFTEAFQNSSQIGRIAVSKLNNGVFSKPEIIINKPYHLSYPCVFEYENRVYMLPETSQNRTLELYVAEDDSLLDWRQIKVICENINCVDTTVFVNEQDVYLISYFQEPNNYSTVVYKLNMINYSIAEVFRKSDRLNISRPAGKVFMNKESNEFYRPVQYNENCYGEKMRILKINPNMNDWMGVEDKQISIEDLHINLIRRTHTFNSVNDIIVVDGLIEHKTLMAPYFVIKRKLHNLKFKMRNEKKI